MEFQEPVQIPADEGESLPKQAVDEIKIEWPPTEADSVEHQQPT
jgi:hypothetical protein